MSDNSSRRLRMIFGGSVGNFVEWFDWFTYAAFALYFANNLFPGRRSNVSASEDGQRLRDWLHCPSPRRLAHGALCRCCRPAEGSGVVHGFHERGLLFNWLDPGV